MAELRASAGIEPEQGWNDQPEVVKFSKLPAEFIFRATDFLSIIAPPFALSLIRQASEKLELNLGFWTLLSVITTALIASHGGYRGHPGQTPPRQTALAICCFLAAATAMLLMAVLLGHPRILARRWTAADLLATTLLIAFARGGLAHRLADNAAASPPGGAIVICYDRCPGDLTQTLEAQHIARRISGVFYLHAGRSADLPGPWPILPSSDALLTSIRHKNIQDVVFIHHPELDALAGCLSRELLSDLLMFPARIWLAFDVSANLPDPLKGRLGTCKLVPIVTDELINSANAAKRVFDLVGGILLLLASSPLLILTACLVKASGPGPVIFRQLRIGAHGRQFHVLKFRTMMHDPHRAFAQATQNDGRVTRIGRFLRRTSLDELLQLINVIKGDMSLVGPRPHAPETQVEGIDFENAVRLYRLRHRVKPGITGLAQIRGQRGETPALFMLEQRLASDLEYIRSWSLGLDIAIMLRTVPRVIAQTNAW